ncbi:DUF551 domain-containing protein [Raoultella ornithinolytica]|uniref:DUF551 domain-containing protein n=1 Tax=Raoultella ornithinolytica TaxID=54291 RepID=UPI001F2A4BCB|nr:DUF551 domain-containing protein [Raoultella ornithinolytica]
MTSKFSIDNRELLQRISSGDAVVGIDFGNLIVRELAAFRLAAMDSEPVAYRWNYGGTTTWRLQDTKPTPGSNRIWPRVIEPLYRHAQPALVVQCPFPCGWDNLNKLAIQDAELVARGLVEGELTTEAHRQAAISNNDRLLKVISSCRAAMLAAAPHDTPALNSVQSVVTVPGKWIPVSEKLPEEGGRYWCYVEEQTDLGKSHYQWNCSWNGERWWVEGEDGGIVTHWMRLPAAPQEVKGE